MSKKISIAVLALIAMSMTAPARANVIADQSRILISNPQYSPRSPVELQNPDFYSPKTRS